MREITLAEMEIVTGAADNNKPVSSADFKSGLIGWAIAEGMNMTKQQINDYVDAYDRNGMSGVAAASPGGRMLTTTMSFISRFTSDGNDYCNDGSNYGKGGKDGGNY